jgi:hypothetical protein
MTAGCAGTNLPASVSGLSRVFREPPHEIRGATPADQRWIDETIETGSETLGWQVKPRPARLDQPTAPAAPAKKPKRRIRDRIKDLVS